MRAHAAAVQALLEAVPNLNVFDGEVSANPPARYVVFYLNTPQGVDQSKRVSADVPKGRYTLSTLYVGTSPNECRWVAERVQSALLRSRLTVAGYVNDPFLPPRASAEVRRDQSTNPPAWVATDVWQFNVTPVAS